MRRPLLLGIMVCAVAAITQAPASSPPPSASAQSVQRVEYRSPVPSCAEGIKQLGLEGQPVSCEEPPAPTYDPPQMHGKFRLVPESYVGPLTYEDVPDTAPRGVVSDNVQNIRTSSIYAEPAWLPEGYSLSSASTHGSDSERMIVLVYAGPGEPIRVNRVRQFTWPINLILPVGDSAAVFETPVLEGHQAVLYYPKSGLSGHTVLSFVDGDVETTVLGERLEHATATHIALSVICGASCAALQEPSGEGQLAETPADSAGSDEAAATGGVATDEMPRSGPMYPNQVRVMAGLGITDPGNPDKNVETLMLGWHGGDYPPGSEEAALDLQDPRGPDYTSGLDVWVTTWPWSGAGQLRFTTEEYEHDPSWCGGRYVRLEDTGYHYRGKLTYVHLDYDNQAPLNETWLSNQSQYWTIHWVGKAAAWQKSGCPFTTIHLHQGQRVEDGGQVTYNPALGTPYITFSETDYVNNWMHSVRFDGSGDWDGDACTDSREAAMGFDPYNYWDFYDVPVPSVADPTPNGVRNRKVDIQDVLAVLLYVFTRQDGPANGNGVDYDSIKGSCDYNADTTGDKEGLCYDRSASGAPNPPWDAGPPSTVIDMADVMAVLAQFGLDCRGGGAGAPEGAGREGGDALDSARNAMAVDAVPGGPIDSAHTVKPAGPFEIDIAITTAKEPYGGYQFVLSYDDQVLALVPTTDVDRDGTPESWAYGRLDAETVDAKVVQRDLDGDAVVDQAAGGSALLSGVTSATAVVATVRFRCVGSGTSPLHLVAPGEGAFGTATLASGGAAIGTGLEDAAITCSVN